MFILKSYLKRPSAKITSLQDINQRAEEYFISINDKESIIKIKDKIDPNYIEGVLYLEYYGVVLMDFTYWDLIDQLWIYITDLIENCIEYGESETFFPDQSIRMSLKLINEKLVSFSIGSNKLVKRTLPKNELFKALLDSGELFFTKLQDYMGLDYKREISKIKNIKRLIE